MGVRDSRLGLEFGLPPTDAGLKTKAILEADFLGNQGANTVPAGAASAQTENAYFTNASLRVRQAYADLTYQGFNAKLGQTWSLLGWQPVYLMPQASVPCGPGEPFLRMPQVRATYTQKLGEEWAVDAAVAEAKPAVMNSGNFETQFGVKVASSKHKAANPIGGVTVMVPMSAGFTGALIPVRTNVGNPVGKIGVLDVGIPIIPSKDGNDRSNNLLFIGEAMMGTGAGVEYPGLSFGVAAPTVANAGVIVDAGIGGIPGSGYFEFIQSRAFHGSLMYWLPGGKIGVGGGYAQVDFVNINDFNPTANTLASKIQFADLNVFYDPLTWLRFGVEFSTTKDTYQRDAVVPRFATNNRMQFSSFFLF